jgi:pantothenate kinase-related protein Tda10
MAWNFDIPKITKAHPKTFRVVFSEKIAPWLQSDDPLFWLSGKAGSGKSTLIKYLINNHETKLHLMHWAGLTNLIVAGYFF